MSDTKKDQDNQTSEAGDKTSLNWPLSADRQSLKSPILECLVMLAGHYGHRISIGGMMAGLPFDKGGISPSLVRRAGDRAKLHTQLVQRSLEALIIAPNFPILLILEKGLACVLKDVSYPNKKPVKNEKTNRTIVPDDTVLHIEYPETPGQIQKIALSDLKEIFMGYAYYVRPVPKLDDRAGSAIIDQGKDWFWGALKKNKSIYVEVVIAALMINMFALAAPLFTMNVYDRVVPNNAFATLAVLAVGIVIVYIFELIMKVLRAHFLDVAGRRADVRISASLFEQALGMKMAARPDSAGVMIANMRDFEGLRDFFTSATITALIDAPFAVLFMIIIGVIAGPLALVPLIMAPIMMLIGYAMQKPMMGAVKESMAENAQKNALMFETIVGLEAVKMASAEGHRQRQWEQLTDRASRTSIRLKRMAAWAVNLAGFITSISTVLLVIGGVFMISEGMMTMGALIASSMLLGRALSPFSQLAALLTRYNQTKETLEQLEKLMDKPVERPSDRDFVSMPEIQGNISFKNVTFRYGDKGVPASNNLNFDIKAGEKIAVIGAVGSGKTTLLRLLSNMYEPESGSIQMDGSDVRQIDPADLRRNMGFVQQNPTLFYGSIRENITMGHETAPQRAVLRAAEIAGVMDFLRDTELGLDTHVGERGERLSGGQRQAVAIARALLYDPNVLLLDEPTASLDPASENRLIKHLVNIIDGKTVFLITHKGAMLSLVDKILLIDRGGVVDFGPRDEIIKKLQSRDYQKDSKDKKEEEA